MNIVDRVKNILLTPKTEWDVIATESTTPQQLVITYVLPLAAIAAIAGFIGSAIIGASIGLLGGTFRVPFVWALVAACFHLVMSVVSVFIVGFIFDTLAPSFGGQKNVNQAIKVAAYSYTAGWVGGVFAIIPILGSLLGLLLSLYGIYILYLGLPKLMKNPDDKTIVYTIVVIVVAIVVSVIAFTLAGLITAPAMMAAGGYSSMARPKVTYDKDSAMGKLDQFAKKMEEAGQKMEAAQKSGDPNKQMESAMVAMGTVLSGGKGVEPLSIDQIKPFVPETFAGLPRTGTKAERTGVTGFMVAKAEATYGDSAGKSVRLEVVDTGGAAGLMGLASWMNVQSEREDENRSERTRKEGDRMVHEEVDKRGGRNKYGVVVANRFMVSAEGHGVDIGTLKSGVNSVDLGKLESTK